MSTSLSAEELSAFRQQLQNRERQLLSELRSGKEQSQAESFKELAGEAPDAGDASVADVVTDGISAERQRDYEELGEVQAALTRIEDGSFGICLRCGKPIDKSRLQALPTAKYDLQHQEEVERQSGAPETPTL